MNCIEADNEIDLSLINERMNNDYNLLIQLIDKFILDNTKYSCPRCHPTFDEDGIL
jgi:hypothetical protein